MVKKIHLFYVTIRFSVQFTFQCTYYQSHIDHYRVKVWDQNLTKCQAMDLLIHLCKMISEYKVRGFYLRQLLKYQVDYRV